MGTSAGGDVASGAGGAAGAGLMGAFGLPLAAAGPIGLGIYALGSALGYAGQRNQEKEQQKIQDEIQNQEMGAHTAAAGAVGDALNTIKNTGANQTGGALASAGDFANALKGVVGQTGAPAVVGSNPRYAAANARNVTQNTPANTGVNSYAAALTGPMAVQNGTTQAARLGQQAIGDTASKVANLQSQAYADQLVGNLASQDITQNPYSAMGAKFLQGAGEAMAMPRIGTGTPTPGSDEPFPLGGAWGGTTNASLLGAGTPA